MSKLIKQGLLLIAALMLFSCSKGSDVLLRDTNGKVFHFSDLHGKWVFINYWASWCHPCKKEIPEFNKFYQQHAKEVAVIGVNFDQVSVEKMKVLAEKMHIQYPNLTGDPAKELGIGDIPGIPATFVFNPEGRLVKKLYGEQTQATLIRAMG